MKKYIIPELKLSSFDIENIVTQSGAESTAMQQAQTAAEAISESQHTFKVTF